MVAAVDTSVYRWVGNEYILTGYENFFSVFDHVFVLSTDLSENDLVASAEAENVVSASLLYNIGLALHKKGLAAGSSQDLQLALNMYRKAGSLVQFTDQERTGQTLLVFLAILNNMAHIYAEMMDIKQMGDCIDAIKMMLECDECHATLGESEYIFFVWSSFLIPEEHVWLSPAA